MNRWDAWIMHAANLLVVSTGIVYAVMRYLLKPADEWAVINHPWQPHLQHLHVLTAPLLVFACGLIWHQHVVENIRRGGRRGRRSGPGLLFALVPMILSGYLIQTTVSEPWRQVWTVVHLISSAAWTLAFFGHFASLIRVRTSKTDTETMQPRSIDAVECAQKVATGDE